MQTFIDQVLQDLHEKHYKLLDCAYVVPSKRVAMFLTQHLATYINKPVLIPKIYSIEEFIAQVAETKMLPDLEILPHFYATYRQIEKKDPDDYDTFITWAPTILADFNEIDRYLVDTTSFFSYLGNIKEMDTNHWSLEENPTQMVSKYLRFWKKLELYYHALKVYCKENQIGYQGLVYRFAFAKAESFKTKLTAQTPMIFLGLNATTTAESHIIQTFLNDNLAHIYWDTDTYYLENKYHEAGKFMRKYLQTWSFYKNNEPLFVGKSFSQAKEIAIIGTNGSLGMAQTLRQLLEGLPNETIENTAIILADETLLFPVLDAIPDAIENINITMGIPVDKMAVASFVLLLTELKSNAIEATYYHKDILEILEHQICAALIPDVHDLIKNIQSQNKVYLKSPVLISQSKALHDLLESDSQDTRIFLEQLSALFLELQLHWKKSDSYSVEMEQLISSVEIVNSLQQVLKNTAEEISMKSLLYFLRKMYPLKKIDIVGSPERGLQIMGILETRALDFENIIMLGVNEGILPAGKSTGSYIPYDMKIKYGLPTYSDKDSIYAYHFYRLLHRSKKATFIYNEQTTVLGAGEESRFIKQLELDRPVNHVITRESFHFSSGRLDLTPLVIIKNDLFIKRLEEINAKGYSPSALASYIRNPLEFYENKILRIANLNEVEENIATNTMGSIVHGTLEKLYEKHLNISLTSKHIDDMLSNLDHVLLEEYKEQYEKSGIAIGKNKIILEVSKHYCYKMLQADKNAIEKGNTILIKHLEKEYKTTVFSEKLGTINILGNVDRIDEFNGQTRIIDYKTGAVEKRHLSFNQDEMKTLITDYDKSKGFQVLVYSLLYLDNNPKTKSCSAGIISFKKFINGFMPVTINLDNKTKITEIDETLLIGFKIELVKLIEGIYDLNNPIVEKAI